ncbi:MAG: phosphonatase-like hydrolase [Lewinella sp.]
MDTFRIPSDLRLFVFDMAGTTVNEDNVVYKTLLATLREAGYELELGLVLEEGAGKEKRQAIRDLLHRLGAPDEAADELYARFRERLGSAYTNLAVTPFPGASDLIGRLRKRGVVVGLNTGYDRATAERLLGKMAWQPGQHYDYLVTADDVTEGRPAPDMIHRLMELADVRVPTFVGKAGDSGIDIDEGKRAGCGLTVGVTTGAQSRDQLTAAGADLVVDDLAALDF